MKQHISNFLPVIYSYFGKSKALSSIFRSKRAVIFLLVFFLLLFYLSPRLFSSLSPFADTAEDYDEVLKQCVEHHMRLHNPISHQFIFRSVEESDYLPFVGNGVFGVNLYPYPNLFLKDSRTLSLSTEWDPLLSLSPSIPVRQIFSTDILTGTVNRYQCFSNGLFVSTLFFAHRTHSNLFYQDIIVSNPTDHDQSLEFDQMKFPDWISQTSFTKTSNVEKVKTLTFSGIIKNYTNQESLAVCFGMKSIPQSNEISSHRTKHFAFPVAVHYEKINVNQFSSYKGQLERKCKETLNWALTSSSLKSQQGHIAAWHKLWNSGLSISHSKAFGALNDDHINATQYYVLSNVVMNDTDITPLRINTTNYISIAEGCYGGYHHTLQALSSLWRQLNTFKEVNETVSLWLLTLEKQGCHKLLRLGAEGVAQAMILSFGGFRFSAHHLEFKIDPKFLHRDYFFRNIKVDYNVHINVSVILQEDNKAVLGVSIDRTDKEYYACDGGCINPPVELRTKESYFPVKMTEPITSILYITADKSHIELIKDTLHVHKIVEAPAHDHHVVALHKHGSHLGGLPLMFWATVITLIVIFHLFLCKLIFNEYCGKQDKMKVKYSRVSTE